MKNTNMLVVWVREEPGLPFEGGGAEEAIRQRRLGFLAAAEVVLSKLSNFARWRLNAPVSDEFIERQGCYSMFWWAEQNEQPVQLVLEKIRTAIAISDAVFAIKCLMHSVDNGHVRGEPIPNACLNERLGKVMINDRLIPFSYVVSRMGDEVDVDEVVLAELFSATISLIAEDKACALGLRPCVVKSR